MSDQPELWDAAPQMTPERSAEVFEKEWVKIPRVHARRTDPYTSDQALKAIANDGTLMAYIWRFANHCATRDGGPFNDSELTEYIEDASGKRQQRNIVARSRGMLEDAGLLRQAGVRVWEGRELMHYEIQPTKENSNG